MTVEWTCLECKNMFNRKREDRAPKCKAFPRGIPFDVIAGKFDHRKKHPEQDNEIVFEVVDAP